MLLPLLFLTSSGYYGADLPVLFFHGTVLDDRGDPLLGALVQFWHTDYNGNYDHPSNPYNGYDLVSNFQYFGECLDGVNNILLTLLTDLPFTPFLMSYPRMCMTTIEMTFFRSCPTPNGARNRLTMHVKSCWIRLTKTIILQQIESFVPGRFW
jgi:hypothetical protein